MSAQAVNIYRGSQIEASHDASIAVVNSSGELTHYLGNPEMIYMSRSSIKPFQSIPLITTGGANKFKFSNKQLAIMCGSHSGSDEHKSVVESILKASGNKPDYLQCGFHRPLGMFENRTYPTQGEDKDSTRHNCSGKHAGFLALAKFLGEDFSEYLSPDSKTQKLIKEAVASYCEFPLTETFYGTDGCSAPNFPLPLKHLALGFMKLATEQGKDKSEQLAISRIKKAMSEYPIMVSGEKRLDFDLMSSFPDNIICKIGAEAMEGIAFSDEKIGIAVKIHDGANRALGPVIVEVLKQLGLVNTAKLPILLQKYEKAEVRNVRNIVTGNIICDFILKKK